MLLNYKQSFLKIYHRENSVKCVICLQPKVRGRFFLERDDVKTRRAPGSFLLACRPCHFVSALREMSLAAPQWNIESITTDISRVQKLLEKATKIRNDKRGCLMFFNFLFRKSWYLVGYFLIKIFFLILLSRKKKSRKNI